MHLSTLMIVGLLVGVAGVSTAQSAQTITVQPDMIHWEDVPQELPGTYRGLLQVRTTVSGGGCLCVPGTTTTVQLGTELEGPVTGAVVSPSSYAIDWWADPGYQQSGHERLVEVTLHVAETDADLVRFQLQTEAHTGSPLHRTEALDSTYAIPLPADVHDDAEQDATSDEDSAHDEEANASQDAEASTQSATDPGQLQQAAVPGAGVLAALMALGIVAWRRRT